MHDVLAGCELSDDEVYRYTLYRVWDKNKPVVIWVMLNPSTADGTTDDQTIRRCMDFARRWGGGGIHVINCYALRSTDPKALKVNRTVVTRAIGPENRRHIYEALLHAKENDLKVVCGWGTSIRGCGSVIVATAKNLGIDLWCLGKTSFGEPRHPLYVMAKTKLEKYP